MTQARRTLDASLPNPALGEAARVVARDGTVVPLGPRASLLVALVALGAASDRADLAGLLYPRLAAAAGRRNLRQLLHKQRHVLGAVIEQRGTAMVIRDGFRVSVEPAASDGESRRARARHALVELARLLAGDARAAG